MSGIAAYSNRVIPFPAAVGSNQSVSLAALGSMRLVHTEVDTVYSSLNYQNPPHILNQLHCGSACGRLPGTQFRCTSYQL